MQFGCKCLLFNKKRKFNMQVSCESCEIINYKAMQLWGKGLNLWGVAFKR